MEDINDAIIVDSEHKGGVMRFHPRVYKLYEYLKDFCVGEENAKHTEEVTHVYSDDLKK